MQVAAQVKQLELKLITLREEVAQKERQARQAEFTVRDLKLELENLQVIVWAVAVHIRSLWLHVGA